MNITQKVFKSLQNKQASYSQLQDYVFKAQGRTRNEVQNPRGYYCVNIGVWLESGYITKNKETKMYTLTKLGRLYITNRTSALQKRRVKMLEKKVRLYERRFEKLFNELDEANYKLNKVFKVITN